MSRLVVRSPVRALVVVLLAWTVIDGALYGACADDPIGIAGAAAETRVSTCGCGGRAPADSALHAHHCFCHAQWIGMAAATLPLAPALASRLGADRPQRRPDSPSRRLDHPPQLPTA